MELYAFPLDSQDLNLMFEMRCAKGSSPFPVQLVLSKDLDATINKEAFMLSNVWSLQPAVVVHTREVVWSRAIYPAISIACRLHRRPSFYLYNVVVPLGLFSLLSILGAASIPYNATADRLSVSLALVLTAAAYKSSIASMVPTISYLTLVDKYVLSQGLLIMLVALQNCLMGMVSGGGSLAILFPENDLTVPALANGIAILVLFGMWCVCQLWFFFTWIWHVNHRSRNHFSGASRQSSETRSPIFGRRRIPTPKSVWVSTGAATAPLPSDSQSGRVRVQDENVSKTVVHPSQTPLRAFSDNGVAQDE